MLHVFQRQKERIEVYVDLVPELMDDKLTEAEWKDIDNILQLLEPFKKLTILGEERGTLYGSVNSILWGMDMLLELLENEKKRVDLRKRHFGRHWKQHGKNSINTAT